jgi:UDP-glucose 4-epimerase
MGGKCLVLGGTGFLGTHLVRRLLAEGQDVRVLARHAPRASVPIAEGKLDYRLAAFEGDIAWDDILEGCDTCVHLIHTTLPKTSNDDMAFDVGTNVVPTLKFLTATAKANLKQLVFISSGGAIYGAPCSLPINELHPTNPISSYGVTKLAIEKYLQVFASRYALPHVILRVANPYGPGQIPGRGQGAVATFLHKASLGEPIEVWGDGSVVRDYIYVDDTVSAIMAALRHRGHHRIFNVGSGHGLSLMELIGLIETTIGRKLQVEFRPGRGFDPPANVLDPNLAITSLDWRPTMRIESGLRATAAWLAELST